MHVVIVKLLCIIMADAKKIAAAKKEGGKKAQIWRMLLVSWCRCRISSCADSLCELYGVVECLPWAVSASSMWYVIHEWCICCAAWC